MGNRRTAIVARLNATDKDFLRLMQWVMLDSNEIHQYKLAEHVFRDLFVAVHSLVSELDSRHDAHMLAISIIGLVLFHFETGITRKFMPGHRPQQDNPAVLAQHVIGLLRNGLGENHINSHRANVNKLISTRAFEA